MNDVFEKLIQGVLENGFGSVDNWFSIDEISNLRKRLLQNYEAEKFRLAGVGNKYQLTKEEAIRNDEIMWLNPHSEVPIEQCFFERINEFVNYLNRTCFAGIQTYEFHYAVYDPGSFYKRHSDQFNTDDRRKFSFVYYLSEEWNEGDGGELMMYVSHEAKIQPLPGRLLFFDSSIEHEVLVSNHQRLSITGWMKTF